MVKSASGVRYKLKANKTQLWLRLCELMMGAPNWLVETPLKPPSWGYFYLETSKPLYEQLTADNCCCGM